jgi:hypothetical protein
MPDRYVKSPNLTQEDLQLIFDCILFSACTDVGWEGKIPTNDKLYTLVKKFGNIGWKGSDALYLFQGSLGYEDELVAKYIEDLKLLRTKGR